MNEWVENMYSYKTHPNLELIAYPIQSTDWEYVAVRGRQLGKYSAVTQSANISSFCILLSFVFYLQLYFALNCILLSHSRQIFNLILYFLVIGVLNAAVTQALTLSPFCILYTGLM